MQKELESITDLVDDLKDHLTTQQYIDFWANCSKIHTAIERLDNLEPDDSDASEDSEFAEQYSQAQHYAQQNRILEEQVQQLRAGRDQQQQIINQQQKIIEDTHRAVLDQVQIIKKLKSVVDKNKNKNKNNPITDFFKSVIDLTFKIMGFLMIGLIIFTMLIEKNIIVIPKRPV